MIKIKRKTPVLGIFKQDKKYITYRTPYHYFRKYNGFGISTKLLLELRAKGCNQIIIVYQESAHVQKLYSTNPDTFLTKGIIYKNQKGDWQRILSLTEFKCQ